MADTPSVKKYVDYAQQQIDEQAIADKFNAATAAQYAVQREQNRQAENQFYNQMYNTQQTAMDTIRKSNAAAVSTGASRGVQAANELSAILGLEQESVAGATELAQANRQTAQEETAAVLENVLKAYQQAVTERQQLTQQGIESASVDVQQDANQVQREANQIAAQESAIKQQEQNTNQARLITEAAENGTNTYLTALTQAGLSYSNGELTPESQASFQVALSNIGKTKEGNTLAFNADDWKGGNSGATKVNEIITTINNICDAYGLDKNAYKTQLDALKTVASNDNVNWAGASLSKDEESAFNTLGLSKKTYYNSSTQKTTYAKLTQQGYQTILDKIYEDYTTGANRKAK